MRELNDALTRYVREQTPTSLPPFDVVRARGRRRSQRRTVALSVGAVVVVAGGATVVAEQLGGGPTPTLTTTTTTTQSPAPTRKSTHSPAPTRRSTHAPSSSSSAPAPGQNPRSGALPSGASVDCVERYGLRTLRKRAFAFDGSVLRVAGNSGRTIGTEADPYAAVTFKVHEWFRGGSRPEITVAMFPPTTTPTPGHAGAPNAEQGPSYGIGTRLLVSGEPRWGGSPLHDPIAWPCGFSRYYDQASATAWRQAFAGKRVSGR